ncbi:hypothetical protein GCM10017708_06370 [Arthrobacter citreus]
MLAGPSWSGGTPEGFDGVIRASTDVVGCLGRTAFTDGDLAALREIQHSYDVRPWHDYAGTAPPAVEAADWPEWNEAAANGLGFYDYLDMLLGFAPVLEEDREVRERLASIGLDGSGRFRTLKLDDAARGAFAQGLAEGKAHLDQVAGAASTSTGMFGTREQMADGYDRRNVGAKKGLYGLPPAIAWYGGWLVDAAGNRITPGLIYDDDGSLTLEVRHTRPAETAVPNWLPSPEGPFTVIIRAYGGDSEIVDGTYRLPPIVPV